MSNDACIGLNQQMVKMMRKAGRQAASRRHIFGGRPGHRRVCLTMAALEGLDEPKCQEWKKEGEEAQTAHRD